MYEENIGGKIKDGDLSGNDIPKLFRELANQIEAQKGSWVEHIRVTRYPSSYSYLPSGFSFEIDLIPKG